MTRELYSYNSYRGRAWNFYGDSKDFNIDKVLYTGLELETEPTDNISYNKKLEIVEYIYQTLNDKNICSTDSSLCDGIEIAFEPMTPSELINNFSTNIKDLMTGLSDTYNFKSHNGGHCGLHIHFTRPYEKGSKEDIDFYNKLCFIFESFKDNIKIISRRKNYSYCSFFSDGRNAETNTFKSIYGLEKNFDYIQGGHSNMINNQNEKTIEIRILRGTLNYDTFIASYKIIVNLFNLAFKNIKDLKNLSFKKAINPNNDIDIKRYISNKGLDFNVRLIDYSKQLINLENIKNAILKNCLKYITKINVIYLKDLSKYKINTKDLYNCKSELDKIFNRIDYINELNQYLTDFIENKSTYYSFNELIEKLRNLTTRDFKNDTIKELIKKILKEINKEY